MPERRNGGAGERCNALLIESDEGYGVVIGGCMQLAGCRVEQVTCPESAFAALERHNFDLIVWGVPPSCAGRCEVISEIRLRTEVPLVLVDGGPEMAQLDLETGADQWVPKPFIPGALIGAVRASLRKTASSIMQVASRVEVRGMVLDGRRRQLSFANRKATFTRQEWDLLSILVSNPNRFLSAREILRLGWRAGEHGAEQLRTYVHRLRLKIEPLNLPCTLLSQHGQGYCLAFA